MAVELDERQVELWVHTFKEGVLSRMGHDLRLRPERLSLTFEPDSGALRLLVPAEGLRVVGALQDGRLLEGELSARDRAEIERNVRDKVLQARRHPQVRFEGTVRGEGPRRQVEGTLQLHGASRPLRCEATLREGRWEARVRLDQRDFGIRPFKAPLGVLKVRPEVEVVVAVAADALGA